jgi:four helix bundle protein
MTETQLKQRTKQFAPQILQLISELPKTTVGYAIGRQARSGTSVGAIYRAACRGRSKAEFIASRLSASRH